MVKLGKIERQIVQQSVHAGVVSQAGANARARQDALAASFYDKPSTRAGKSEAEKQAERWADILKSADQQQRAIEQAGDRIGKYGIDLDQITNVQNLFNKAQDAGIEITKRGTIALNEQGLELQRRAIRMADAANDNRIAEFNESLTKSFEQQMMALRSEAAELGLTGAALAAYRYEQEALNAAKAVGLAQDSEAIQRIREQGAEYAAQVDAVEKARKAIEDQRRAMEASREIVSGFFLDWINGVREGENVFRAFEKSVIRALNNIIDKLIQAAIEQMLFNSIAGSGGGSASGIVSLIGGLFANGGTFGTTQRFATGGMFDTAQRFANGGAFTNRIVNTPTLFRFANGAKMGEMGEAGPEAIMPLTRGPNGKLGVQASGGGRPSISIGDINQNIKINGGFTPESAIAMIRQGGQEVINEVRRNLDTYLREWDTDGAVAA